LATVFDLWAVGWWDPDRTALEAFKRARAELERWLAEQAHGRAEMEFGARGRAIITRGTDP
jgi:hypothetical protein